MRKSFHQILERITFYSDIIADKRNSERKPKYCQQYDS